VNQPPISDHLVGPFLELLETLRAVCHGDIDKNIILLSIAVRTVRHPEFGRITDAQRLSGEHPAFPNIGANGRSIAESSGMARETVRRKVAELIAAGWIGQSGRNLHYTAEGYRALTPAREALVRTAELFAEVVDRHRKAAGKP
jgi:hypothetical protein